MTVSVHNHADKHQTCLVHEMSSPFAPFLRLLCQEQLPQVYRYIPCQGLRRPAAFLAAQLQAALEIPAGSWASLLQHTVPCTGYCFLVAAVSTKGKKKRSYATSWFCDGQCNILAAVHLFTGLRFAGMPFFLCGNLQVLLVDHSSADLWKYLLTSQCM